MKTRNRSEIHIFKIAILSQAILDRGEHMNSKRLLGIILLLLAASICLVSAYIYAQDNNLVTQTIMSRSYYYVDNNTSDVDSSSYKGNQANFTAQQYGPDSDYDTLTEEGATEIIEDYVDIISNVDGSPDIGTHSNFTAQQYGPDSVFDMLTEYNTGSASNTTLINAESFEGTWPPTDWTETFFSAWNRESDTWSKEGIYSADFDGGGGFPTYLSGYLISPSMDCSDADAIYIDFWWYDLELDDDDFELELFDGSMWDNYQDLNQLEGENGEHQYTVKITDSQYFVSNFQIRWWANSVASFETGCVDLVTVKKETPAPDNYDLDLEVQFTNIIDFLSTEKLCVYMGTMGAEALNVSYWTGSSWSLLDSDLTASSWNNYTVSLSGANFTIRFETATLAGDSSADTYQVDAVLLQVSGVGSKEDPVDQQSDIDSSPDIGTHSNFTAQHYGPDSIYDTLAEEDTGGGSTTFGKTNVGASSRGFTGYLEASRYQCGQDFTVTKILLYLSGGTPGYYARTAIYSDSSGAPGSLLGQSAEQEIASSGWHEFTGFNVPVSQNTYYWLAFQISTSNLAYNYDTGVANQHAYIAYTYGSFPSTFGSPSYTAEAQSIYAASSVVNYEIDIEIQWDDLPNSLPNEELCIRTGTFSGSETIQVKAWNNTGSSWDWIMNLTANQWNNASITDHLTSNQFTIQFLGGNETGDSTQDTWEIDVAIIHIWIAENYEIDLEAQWINVDYSETNEELCIYGGIMGSESLRVDVWTGASWQNLIASLNSGWNNVSVSAYLVSSTFTIRFKGSVETADTTQDTWQIDAALLHLWT